MMANFASADLLVRLSGARELGLGEADRRGAFTLLLHALGPTLTSSWMASDESFPPSPAAATPRPATEG